MTKQEIKITALAQKLNITTEQVKGVLDFEKNYNSQVSVEIKETGKPNAPFCLVADTPSGLIHDFFTERSLAQQFSKAVYGKEVA